MDNRQIHIVDMQLIEYTGYFKILNPHEPKMYYTNIYKLAVKIELLILTTSFLISTFALYYTSNDINVFVSYALLFIVGFDITLNHFCLIENSDKIWECLNITKMYFLLSGIPREEMVTIEHSRYKIATKSLMISWFVVFISWIFTPLLQRDQYLTIELKNNTYNYRCLPLNLIMPITDNNIFNPHYIVMYMFEATVIICSTHASLLFDLIVLTVCISIECQLLRIANSYSSFTLLDEPVNSKQYYLYVSCKNCRLIAIYIPFNNAIVT